MPTNEQIARYEGLIQDDFFVDYLQTIYSVAIADFENSSFSVVPCLRRYKDSFSSAGDFFLSILLMDERIVEFCDSIGKVFTKKVQLISYRLCTLTDNSSAFAVYKHKELVESLQTLLLRRITNNNPRFINSFQQYFDYCHNSVAFLYYITVITNSNEVKYPTLGKDKSKHLYNFLIEITKWIDEMVVSSHDLHSSILLCEWSLLGFNEEELLTIKSTFDRIGFFPLYKAISIKVDSFENRDKVIVYYCLNIFRFNQMIEMQDVALQLGLTRERVRQLRNQMIDRLKQIIKDFKAKLTLNDNGYNASSLSELKSIAEREDVSFNDNFIVWVQSLINDNYRLIGNVERLFLKFPPLDGYLCLVPKSLALKFKFDLFINAVEEAISEKRYYEYRMEIEAFVDRLCKSKLDEADFFEVIRECRKILERCYPDHLINNQIIFYANSRKAIPDIIEDVLRENNLPMKAEEISDVINSRYSDMQMTPNKIRANALRNNNVVAVSRKSTYALVDWNDTSKRGGTIREIAIEYLNSLIEPIAPLSNICEYISLFREGIKASNVKANLLAEYSNKFSLYYKDNEIYIGFTDYHYDESFKPQEKRQGRRSFEDSLNRFEKFIVENEHFPFSSGVDSEQIRLSRFYMTAKSNIRRGTITPQEQAEIERIDTMYSQFKSVKDRISWMQQLKNFTTYLTNNDSLPALDSSEYSWYKFNKELYENNMLNDTKRNAFSFLIKIVERMN